jgi:outer membrane lipoprotein LolB
MHRPSTATARGAHRTGRGGAWLGLLAVALGGCAALAPGAPPLHSYSGRFAATVADGERREAASGRFTLAVYPDRITVELASPLGNTLARVQADGRGATLTAPQADGTLATWHGASADALAESALGFALPVSGLADWLAGRPAPGRPSVSTPAAGPAQRIEQDGWTVAIEERFDGSGEPRRLILSRDARPPSAPALRLRLVLDAPAAGGGEAARQ